MSGLFDNARELFLRGELSWNADTIRIMGVDHSVDNPNLATDTYFSDIAAGARRGNSGASGRTDMPTLAGKTTTDGVADADDVTLTLVTGGLTLSSYVTFMDTGADGTSPLISKTDSGTGIPTETSGGDIGLTFSNGVSKVFKL